VFIVIITTPSLKPTDSVATAITLNWWVVLGLMFGTAAQGFLSAYATEKGCRIRHVKAVSGGTGVSSALLSFVSFLSLVPVGCCGTWLYILSFVPSLLGASFAGLLIERSLELQLGSLFILFLSVAYSFFSVRRRSRVSSSNAGP
jgi:hypothetical protein